MTTTTATRRNLRRIPQLPAHTGMVLMAIAYGTGKDDYLAVVLGYNREENRWATWIWNFSGGPDGFANGHYFEGRYDPEAGTKAYQDFCERSRCFITKAPLWEEENWR